MASFVLNLFYCSIVLGVIMICANAYAAFDQYYQPLWGSAGHLQLLNQGTEVQLLLDELSGGAGFRSKSEYCSGAVRMKIKIPTQKSAGGIVVAFFLTNAPIGNSQVDHDELDFEFLGTTGSILQTNVFVNDQGHREERVQLWFDPSADFHLYEIDWNQQQAVFSVDARQVRVFNTAASSFFKKPFRVEASLWNGSWVGNIGTVDWSQEPFTAQYTGFNINTPAGTSVTGC